MLRLTTINELSGRVTVKVEGRINSEGISVLEQECRKHLHQQTAINLDFRSVTFVDQVGKDLLHLLAKENVQIINCPEFIEELLRE